MSITAQPAITKVELKGYVEKELVLNTTTGKYEVEFVLDHQWGRVKFDVTKDNSTEPIRLTHNITQFKGTGIVPNKVEGSTDDERLYADSDEMFNNGEYCYALANGTKTYYKAVYDPKNNTLTIDVDLSKVTGVSVTGDAQTDLVLNTTTGKFEGQFSLSEAWKSVHFLMKFGEDARDILIKYTNSTVKGTGVLSAMSTTGSPNTVELFADTDNMVNAGTFMLSIGTEINYFVSFDPSTNVLMINVIPASMKVTTPNGNVDLVLNSETGLYEGEFTMPSGWPQASIVCVVNAQVDYKLKFSNTKYAGTGVVDHLAGCQWDSRLFCDNTDVADGNLCVNLSAEKTFTISYDVKAGIVTINFKA